MCGDRRGSRTRRAGKLRGGGGAGRAGTDRTCMVQQRRHRPASRPRYRPAALHPAGRPTRQRQQPPLSLRQSHPGHVYWGMFDKQCSIPAEVTDCFISVTNSEYIGGVVRMPKSTGEKARHLDMHYAVCSVPKLIQRTLQLPPTEWPENDILSENSG